MKKIKKLIIMTFVMFAMIVINTRVATALDNGKSIEKYPLEKFLENYNVVTLGMNGDKDGSATIFHITGQYLINGNLNVSILYNLKTDDNATSCATVSSQERIPTCSSIGLNFENLYNSIVEQQKQIQKGLLISNVGNIELTPGKNYTITNIDKVNEIRFSDFSKNEKELTIITIEDEGTVKIPSTYYITEHGEKNMVVTNDWLGGFTHYNPEEEPHSSDTKYNYDDVYYGNIVWNFPNATKLEFSGVPFFGHIIAPKADVEMPESNFASGLIVNSLVAEKNTEAHFYPLQVDSVTRELGTKKIKISLGCNCEDGAPDPRPASATIDIYANGFKYDSIVLSKENDWTYIYYDLPKTSDGKTDIEYTLGGEYLEGVAGTVDGFDITLPCVAVIESPDTSDIIIKFAIIGLMAIVILVLFVSLPKKDKFTTNS